MAVIVFLALVVLGFIQNPLQLSEELHAAMHGLIQNLIQQLSLKVTQLLQDIEQTQEQSGVARKVLFLTTSQQFCFWASAVGATALILVLWLCWRTRKRSHKPGSSCQHSSPGGQDEEEEEQEEEIQEYDDDGDDDSGDEYDLGRYAANSIQWPALYMADTCKLVEELVDDLLCACQRLSRNTFKPRLQPAIGLGCVCQGWAAREDNVLYRLLLPLQPPPGHAFCLEQGTTKDMLTSDSCLRVQLQCMCTREQLVEDMLCFLHHSSNELKSQGPSLLNTLCTKSYLDIEKTACWFQMLVKDAWKLLPLSRHCQLTVLPSARSCKIRLTHGQETLSIEMIFGVPLDDSGSFLSLE
ncbi:inositol 1,4,5-trisphosphate receptor-interacting protein-like 1 [Grus americana]|uniref:inositol 1,4,5-trisphosphate receptor-interacting protein-like 1 n=1 Tax=Grus americana TaxID=9117 RepID=UPI002407F2B9|nr:inositol 1,4,5-trisphosphate receptor-interacting protein-like 1 [Grus americana]